MARCGPDTMVMKAKVFVSYECEYDRVWVKNISCNKAFLASLDLTPFIPRWKSMDIQPNFVFLRLFVHNVNIIYLIYVVCLSCNIHTTSKKILVTKGNCIEGSHSSSKFDVGNEFDSLSGNTFEELEFWTKCVQNTQLNMVVPQNHKVSYVALFSSYFVFKCKNEVIVVCANFILVFLFTWWRVFNSAICGSTICS
jgi:hypothetical protein